MLLGKSACRIYGIWINSRIKNMHFCCRSPRGERGLKYLLPSRKTPSSESRSPRGERGLKSFCFLFWALALLSLPPRGAWIEIREAFKSESLALSRSPRGERGLKCKSYYNCPFSSRLSLPPRGAWIEISHGSRGRRSPLMSLPPRGAWIEIGSFSLLFFGSFVAPPAGSVD